ncbi:hypothetical protein DFJ73DRAFT_156426 [Zopfochytrium polystomum]|nr:hypothetical protein DFJ73DRAFT_156426 [Zopfochytrium polystomum]
MPPPPAAGPGIAASSAPTTTTTTTPLFSECLPIASTLSCTPYTSRFYINATALSSRYASILPFFAPVSRTDMDSVDGGLAAVAAPSKPGRKSGAQASFASAGPTLTADVWDQIVASVSNPSDAVARYFAIASATSENPAGLFNVDPCMAGSATSSGAALPLDRRTPSIYGGGDFVANHRKSGSVGDSSPGYWGAIAPVIGGVDGRGAGGPMFQRSVLCGYDLFVASAGCNTAEVRHNLEAAAAIESKGAPPSGRTPAPRKSDSTKTRRSKGPPAASSGSGSAASSGPVLPFCSSVCTMVSNSLVEACKREGRGKPCSCGKLSEKTRPPGQQYVLQCCGWNACSARRAWGRRQLRLLCNGRRR